MTFEYGGHIDCGAQEQYFSKGVPSYGYPMIFFCFDYIEHRILIYHDLKVFNSKETVRGNFAKTLLQSFVTDRMN